MGRLTDLPGKDKTNHDTDDQGHEHLSGVGQGRSSSLAHLSAFIQEPVAIGRGERVRAGGGSVLVPPRTACSM